MKKSIIGALAAVTAIGTSVLGSTSSIFADGSSCSVKNGSTYYTSINEAVADAVDGDVLKVYPGVCDITRDDATMVEGQAGWYLPITKSITIMGVDESGNPIADAAATEATLYSSKWVANGAHASQNLITIFADDVTISGLTLMDKPDGNKTVEIVDGVDSFTIKDSRFAPLAKDLITLEAATAAGYTDVDSYYEDYQYYGAALYFTGNVTKANVTGNMFEYSGLTFDHTNEADIAVTDNTFFGVKHWSDDPNYIYKSVNYTNWGGASDDLTNFDLTFTKNALIDSGTVNFAKATAGAFNFDGNYWGSEDPDFDSLVILPETEDFTMTIDNWYTALNEDGSIDEDSIYPPVEKPEVPKAPDTSIVEDLTSSYVALGSLVALSAAAFIAIKARR